MRGGCAVRAAKTGWGARAIRIPWSPAPIADFSRRHAVSHAGGPPPRERAERAPNALELGCRKPELRDAVRALRPLAHPFELQLAPVAPAPKRAQPRELPEPSCIRCAIFATTHFAGTFGSMRCQSIRSDERCAEETSSWLRPFLPPIARRSRRQHEAVRSCAHHQ